MGHWALGISKIISAELLSGLTCIYSFWKCGLIPFHKKYDVDVGWVEERNPTPQRHVIVGFHSVQPNLRICLIFFWNWYNKLIKLMGI